MQFPVYQLSTTTGPSVSHWTNISITETVWASAANEGQLALYLNEEETRELLEAEYGPLPKGEGYYAIHLSDGPLERD